MPLKQIIRSALAGTALLGIAGCVSLLPEPNVPAALYRIGPVQAIEAQLGASVIVREPEAPRILAGEAMVTADGNGAIRLIDGVEWADAATRLLQLALLDALNGEGDGLALSPQFGGRATYEVSWRVADLSLHGDRAVADFEITLLDGNTRQPLVRSRATGEVTATSTSGTDRAEALVGASRTAISKAAKDIAIYSAIRKVGGLDEAG